MPVNTPNSNLANGFFWSAFDRLSAQALQFILGLILARLLLPSDYGLVGMLSIFLAISQTFIDSGFSSALIQKKNRTETDFSTIFFFNIVIAIIFFLFLFLLAPLIAAFYNEPKLIPLTRVLSFNIVINSFSVIQRTILSIKLDFKTQAKATFISISLGGIAGITLAYNGFGVWALVFQALLSNFLNTIFLWFFSYWKPKAIFSFTSLKQLFSFGSKLLGAGLLNTIFDNLYYLIIGKIFSAKELGFYTRAKQFQKIPSQNLSSIIQRVIFPAFSSIQDDKKKLKESFQKTLRFSAFVVFPILTGLAMVADPLINVILTEKWAPSAPLLKLLCLAGMFYPIHMINLNVLNALGHSDLFLKLEIIKKALIISSIAIALPFGVKALIIGQIIVSLTSFFLNSYYSGKFVEIDTWKQIKILIPYIIINLLMAFTIFLVDMAFSSEQEKLVWGVSSGITIYILLSRIAGFNEIGTISSLIKNKLI